MSNETLCCWSRTVVQILPRTLSSTFIKKGRQIGGYVGPKLLQCLYIVIIIHVCLHSECVDCIFQNVDAYRVAYVVTVLCC